MKTASLPEEPEYRCDICGTDVFSRQAEVLRGCELCPECTRKTIVEFEREQEVKRLLNGLTL